MPPSVKPRVSHYIDLPIIAIDSTEATIDENGEIRTLQEVINLLPASDGFLLVANRSARVLARIQEAYQHGHGWTSKTTRKQRTLYYPNRPEVQISIHQVVSHYCGWKSAYKPHRGRRTPIRRISYFLDPIVFYGNDKTLSDIFGSEWERVDCGVLLRWGQVVRRFCFENDIPYKQTTGAIAAQFLTDRRFYPEPRRKVPKATNAVIRRKLPGNYVKLTVVPSPRFRYNGFYLDQRRAHHYHAAHTRFPNSDSLFAYGDYRELKRVSLHPDSGFLDEQFAGYICGDFTPPTHRVSFLPPNWRRRAISRRFVSTAEWPFLSDIGVRCDGIVAAWGSFDRDLGLSRYAKFCDRELDRWESDRRFDGAAWLKPILLSTYGVLAVNVEENQQEALYGDYDFLQSGRTPDSWPAGDKLLWGKAVRRGSGGKTEPGITNVLHRALIESATRTESISYANFLESLGYRILMIHVDGLIVEDNEDIMGPPPLQNPWRFKTYMGGIEFLDNHSFTSYQMTRMPGRPIRSREWVRVGHAQNRLDGYLLEPIPEPA